MNESRILEIERRLGLQARQLDDIASKLTQVQQEVRRAWMQGWSPGGSSTGVYYIDPVVISAGGNVTGQTVKYLVGGVATNITTNGTVYNKMDAATVSTANKIIVVGPNGDGTYLAISQSC